MPIWLPPSFKGIGLPKRPQKPKQPDNKYRPTPSQRLRAGAATLKRRLKGVRPNPKGLRDIELNWPVYKGPIPVPSEELVRGAMKGPRPRPAPRTRLIPTFRIPRRYPPQSI